ncbi:hypothetical protein [Streptomyces sp. NPDC047000]|uniref:hypothetical protein n=1 Tax=Streptomyces sp. NPDC047000 TaxID=3155474 RepID=UPI0033DBB1C5
MKMRGKASLVAAGSMLLIGFTAGPSQAAVTHIAGCSTTGASGTVNTSGWDYGDNSIPSLTLTVWDTESDGHHAQIRLVAQYPDTVSFFPWHSNYDGYATSKEFDSYVAAGGSISDVGIQVARYEGSTQLNHCTKWVSGSTMEP